MGRAKVNECTKRYYDEAYLRRWSLGQPDERVLKNTGFLLKELRIGEGETLLDVGCGQGRYSLAFAKNGLKVTGLDASDALISEANRLAQEMALSVEWIVGDMRRIPFENDFDGATLVDAFGFFEDDSENREVIQQISKALKPGARLVLVVVNGQRILNNFRAVDKEEKGDLTVEINRVLLTQPRAMKEVLRFTDGSSESTYDRYQRLYSAEELSELVSKAGFHILDIYGDLAGLHFDPGSSEEIVLVAERSTRGHGSGSSRKK